jgi:DNA-binding NtrC family response regulator
VKPLVYFIDDSAPIRIFYEHKLADDYAVFTFSEVEELLLALVISVPSVMVCDLIMPHVNGIEVVHLVRAKYPDIPIIIATSMEGFSYETLSKVNNCSYWNKASDLSSLKELIENVKRDRC